MSVSADAAEYADHILQSAADRSRSGRSPASGKQQFRAPVPRQTSNNFLFGGVNTMITHVRQYFLHPVLPQGWLVRSSDLSDP